MLSGLSGLSGLSAVCGGGWTPGALTGLAPSLSVAAQRFTGKLWQDTGKTVAAVADGDPVRVATCPWTGVDYTAPSDAARPLLYSEGSGKWSLSFDGVDDYLTAPHVFQWQALQHSVHGSFYIANTPVDYADFISIAGQSTDAWRMNAKLPGAGIRWGTYASGSLVADTSLNIGSRYVAGMDGGNFFLNGVSDGTYAASEGNGGAGPATTLVLGEEFGYSRLFIGRMAGVVICTQPQPDAVADISTYLASLAP